MPSASPFSSNRSGPMTVSTGPPWHSAAATLLAEDAVGDREGLLRVAGIVLDVEGDGPAADPTLGVDGLGGLLRPRYHLVARGRHRAGARHRHGDADVTCR